MPPSHHHRTPIADRIYRVAPALIQSLLPSLRRAGPNANPATPTSSSRSRSSRRELSPRQSTLTQMEFVEPRRTSRTHEVLEIPDSEDDEAVERTGKRRRVSPLADGWARPARQDT